ncbi:hypothetical protein O3P69_015679 [Scylla paramamosain]|uniref:Uncharacterized protein n=1 Tax=Scylla paramamosain TaxID=85552 RepID=A0AAW0S9C1_SCYPA
MESQDDHHDRAEGGSSEVKPGQMDLIAAMLAGMRQEMAVDREPQTQRAREQVERTDQLAREQAQRADDQVYHLEDVLQSSLVPLKAETQQYTNQACHSVRNELLDKVQTLEEALQRRFRHHHQAEVYWARLKKRTRERGETLSQLAQDVEALVRRSHPAALEEMIVVLA